MKCPYQEIDCSFVDTSDMTKEVDCHNCKYRVFTPEEIDRTEKRNEFIKGNQEAFTEIFNKYRNPLYCFIKNWVKNETDAEDLVMDSFERAFTGINNYVFQEKLGGWLYVIAKNTVIDFLRVKKITPHTIKLSPTIMDINTPDKICIHNEELRIAQDGIRTLRNYKYRKVMILYCQGYKMREIAEEMRMPMGTVQGYIGRSKLKLRRLLA